MSAPRGLLLDFGSVISVSIFERHRQSEAILGLAPNSLRWQGPIAPESDELWQALQREEITERDYWARRAAQLAAAVGEQGWDAKAMFTRLRQSDPEAVVRPQMQELILAAHAQGIRLGILSNELDLFYGAEFRKRMRVLEHFATLVDATYTGILKPDPRAYAEAVQKMGLPAHEILFVDDQYRNITGAVKFGLQTQLFDLRDVAGNIGAIATRLRLAAPARPT